MFRIMRDVGVPLSKAETIKIFEKQKHGTLAVNGDDGYPYAVPISFVYINDTIIFHSSIAGHKLDRIRKDPKVSFCVIGQDNIVPDEFNTLYRSAIAFGKARIIVNDQEKREALREILKKYSPDFMKSGEKYIDGEWDNVAVVIIDIEHMTGKAGD